MRRDARAFLWDAREAVEAILQFTRGRSLDDYLVDPMLRSAVERQFEILGEALGQLRQRAPALAERIPDIGAIVGFRNLLIHGYAVIDHRIVWRTIEQDIGGLRDLLHVLLSELGDPG
ncbi:MAG: DUF86 domain-containing protein [Candidatus Rokubacteria bacterium]|nr:DUF86 domain-containing protein [Candidatus Rokubacteria bacterium]